MFIHLRLRKWSSIFLSSLTCIPHFARFEPLAIFRVKVRNEFFDFNSPALSYSFSRPPRDLLLGVRPLSWDTCQLVHILHLIKKVR